MKEILIATCLALPASLSILAIAHFVREREDEHFRNGAGMAGLAMLMLTIWLIRNL